MSKTREHFEPTPPDTLALKARNEQCTLMRADDYTLLLDFDDYKRSIDARMLAFIGDAFGARVVDTWISRHGTGQHVVIKLDKSLPLYARIALQAALGSDPIREILAVMDAYAGVDNVCLFKPAPAPKGRKKRA